MGILIDSRQINVTVEIIITCSLTIYTLCIVEDIVICNNSHCATDGSIVPDCNLSSSQFMDLIWGKKNLTTALS